MQPEAVQRAVLEQYARLPSRGKPITRSNGVKEWTVLAGVVVEEEDAVRCVALATGVKTTPSKKYKDGCVLHDCHAEILALRAFNAYMVCNKRPHKVYLYICAPPCGDASAPVPPPLGDAAHASFNTDVIEVDGEEVVRGRANYSLVGRIRTKPGRRDSPLSLSKSCSDKLCLRMQRGVLLAPLRKLHAPIYLDALVCPPTPHLNQCFSRFETTTKFEILSVNSEFADYHPETGAPAKECLVWAYNVGLEVIANGLVQGKPRPSFVSRKSLTSACVEQNPELFSTFTNYYELKGEFGYPPGWVRTPVDDFKL